MAAASSQNQNITTQELLNNLLKDSIPVRFQAAGDSMAPFIKNNDFLTISPLLGQVPVAGDIVAHLDPRSGKLMVHRLISLKNSRCITKGDNHITADAEISRDKILGILTRIERGGVDVRFGNGFEKSSIAWLSRKNVLPSLLSFLRRLRDITSTRLCKKTS